MLGQVIATSATRLWTDTNPTEAWYQRGKIQNLRQAAARLDRCVIPAGEVFSFWQQVGRASARKGYVAGRMLQEGCMIPAIGGGLCQLSNALYQVALDAGCEILERHPHSRIVPDSATAAGRDATVAWNYIDLRFRARATMQLRVILTATELLVSLHTGAAAEPESHSAAPESLEVPGIFSDHACESCGNTTCFRHEPAAVHLASRSATAFLLDGAWPEFKSYVAANHKQADILATPLDGTRWNRSQYAWPTAGFSAVHTATVTTLLRAARSRRLATQGAARQKALLVGAAALATQLGKALTPGVDEVCVSQILLPFLWRSGALGGRRIRVLMTQIPAKTLQAKLDEAFLHHPESTILKDFRAEDWLIEAEEEALSYAEQIVTPHAYLGSLFATKVKLLDWSEPKPRTARPATPNELHEPPVILFPCATLGRKGAYELREAIHDLDVRLVLGGKILEDPSFWDGFNTIQTPFEPALVPDLVVLPSIVESQPRSLLQALADGIPVLTTRESGIHANSGARFVPVLDSNALRAAILEQLARLAQARQIAEPSLL